MRQLETLCPNCGEPLWEVDNHRYYYTHLCNNFNCRLSHQPQGYRKKEETVTGAEEVTLSAAAVTKTEKRGRKKKTNIPDILSPLDNPRTPKNKRKEGNKKGIE